MHILSIQVGQPRHYGVEGAEDPLERPWTSAIHKEPVRGRVWVGVEGVASDSQANRKHHGGPTMAVLGYSASHYPDWRAELDTPDLGYGAFGENLTLDGATEHTVCVGDVCRVADAVLVVTKPRQPCQTLARHFRRKDMVDRVLRRQAFGWYYRVAEEGWLEAGSGVTILDRPYPHWTVKEVARVMRERSADVAAADRLAQCPALPDDWRARLSEAVANA